MVNIALFTSENYPDIMETSFSAGSHWVAAVFIPIAWLGFILFNWVLGSAMDCFNDALETMV